MNKENELEYLVAIYGIFYFTLKENKLIGERAEPLKLKGTSKNQKNDDSIAVYKWLSEQIKGLSTSQLKTRAGKFNDIVKALQDNFFLNQYLLGIFMLQYYLEEEASVFTKNMMMPKVERLIKAMREGIKKTNGDKGTDIILDSSKAGSNVWRMFNGKVQLTKELREARRKMWKEAARKKEKTIDNLYSLE